jgi:hypothetical protein
MDHATGPRRRRQATYPISLHQKLIIEAYGVHFNVRQPYVRAEALVAHDQSRSGELREQPGSRNFLPGGSGSGRAATAMSALTTSASSQARPVSHETRNAVEHMGQACLEPLLPLILGEAGRQAVHRRETPGSAQCRAPIASDVRSPPASLIDRPPRENHGHSAPIVLTCSASNLKLLSLSGSYATAEQWGQRARSHYWDYELLQTKLRRAD